MSTAARRDGDAWVLDGAKTWISNGGIADFYVVVRRRGRDEGISAFVVDADDAGTAIAERIESIAPHPLATLEFDECRVPARSCSARRAGLQARDAQRSTSSAPRSPPRRSASRAARSTRRSRARASRKMFGQTLADFQLTQAQARRHGDRDRRRGAARLSRGLDCATSKKQRVTREAAMAKMFATEAAQRVIDDAVQIFGGRA